MRRFLLSVAARVKGIDPFYAEIPKDKIVAYQRYVERVLSTVNVSNYTNWTMGKEYDKAIMQEDDRRMEEIIRGEAVASDRLIGPFLQVMLHQYYAADIVAREMDKEDWVRRVMHRERIDYFPDPRAIVATLFDLQ